ncbi:hypothetical protein [Janthinobacterium fluminis]|uniref:Amino acid ABC transporter substrate-binding protein n=1 Tax=Janthinobacterium fluminis TaxID=2987524 RepID=A0ABT5K0Y4_9BURK|nr:hypothetical protein [Janthinobacterium fluminis]MDC8758361.1 hypothetical protein [Janthinobacterium fluminis]
MPRCLPVLLLCLSLACARADTIIYPRHQAEHDPQLDYVLALLRLALAKSGTPYTLRQSAQVMVQSRVIQEIVDGTGSVNIVWTMTSHAREAELLPIRIPIDRGLIGWRIALLSAKRAQLFQGVHSVRELGQFAAGQMRDWPDTAILQHNGLHVFDGSTTYEGLFKQLAVERIDYFPRSVIEVGSELASHAGLQLALDPYLIIRYPTAFYFFVGKQQTKLARDIEAGLEKALADGSFNALFQRHYGRLADGLNLGRRRVLELDNPLLPKATPLGRKELWYRLPAN